MKRYTIGILFNNTLDSVVLIEKQKPDWQKGLLNFPGGKIEDGETSAECIFREFKEECNVFISHDTWKHIGRINNEGSYFVDVFTTRNGSPVKTMTDETVLWYKIDEIPENRITNIIWLLEFARNFHKQGANDLLAFGTFEYQYPTHS